jgi:tetratricopeptide (TPR) repeat protein
MNFADRFEIEKIAKLYEKDDFVNCKQEIISLTKRLGKHTPWLHWIHGVCDDVMGDHLSAHYHFKLALAEDPHNWNYIVSLTTNIMMFKKRLNSEPSFDEVKRIHDALTETGEFSSMIQFLVARNYVRLKKYKEAQMILHIYLMANPNDFEAIQLESEMDLVRDEIRQAC